MGAFKSKKKQKDPAKTTEPEPEPEPNTKLNPPFNEKSVNDIPTLGGGVTISGEKSDVSDK